MTIPNQLNPGDVRTLRTVMKLFDKYTYLEIGSYLGGSLHPHLTNPACQAATSVDTRATGQIRDERNIRYAYSVSTEDMLKLLTDHDIPLNKLTTVDGSIDAVPTQKFNLIFVDGEHTNSAVLHDAEQCLRFEPDVVLFHDDWIVHAGLGQASELALGYTLHKIAGSDISALVAESWADKFKLTTVNWQEFVNTAKTRLEQYANT